MPERPSPEPPHHDRRILLCATGMSPAVVTETAFALAQACPAAFPTEAHIVTTTVGAAKAEPLATELANLCRDYGLPPVDYGPANVHLIGDGASGLPDIRTVEENRQAADCITALVRELTSDDDAALHVSIAGGRKTMGYYTGYALSLYGRLQDRLSHVLVSDPFDTMPGFFYPPREMRVFRDRNDNEHDASKATVTLATTPFVRLRDGLPDALLGGTRSFTEVVDAAQRTYGPLSVTLNPDERWFIADGVTSRLRTPKSTAFLAWILRRQQAEKLTPCPKENPVGQQEKKFQEQLRHDYRDEFRRIYLEEVGGDYQDRAFLDGMSASYFNTAVSELNTELKTLLEPELGVVRAQQYVVKRDQRGGTYGIRGLAPHRIRFESSPF